MTIENKVIGQFKFNDKIPSSNNLNYNEGSIKSDRREEVITMLNGGWGYSIKHKEWVEILDTNGAYIYIIIYGENESMDVVDMSDLCLVEHLGTRKGEPIIGGLYVCKKREHPFTLVRVLDAETWLGDFDFKTFSLTAVIKIKDVS